MAKAKRVLSTPPTNTPTSRRGFLGRTVAAFAAAGAANVTAMAATRPAATAPGEHPDLVAAGQRLVVLQAEYQEADALRSNAIAVANALAPRVPDEIVVRGPQCLFWACCTDELRDIEGKIVERGVHIIDSRMLTERIDKGYVTADGRTKFGKKCRSLIAIAQKYEAERDAAIEQSRLQEHQARVYWAGYEIKKLAREVAEIEPQTIAGVAVLARFQCAFEALEEDREKGHSAMILGPPMARAVARLDRDAVRLT